MISIVNNQRPSSNRRLKPEQFRSVSALLTLIRSYPRIVQIFMVRLHKSYKTPLDKLNYFFYTRLNAVSRTPLNIFFHIQNFSNLAYPRVGWARLKLLFGNSQQTIQHKNAQNCTFFRNFFEICSILVLVLASRRKIAHKIVSTLKTSQSGLRPVLSYEIIIST